MYLRKDIMFMERFRGLRKNSGLMVDTGCVDHMCFALRIDVSKDWIPRIFAREDAISQLLAVF